MIPLDLIIVLRIPCGKLTPIGLSWFKFDPKADIAVGKIVAVNVCNPMPLVYTHIGHLVFSIKTSLSIKNL